MNRLRWSEDKTVKFVQLYRDHENLWNMSSPEYRSREARNMSLQIIVDEMGDPTLSIKDVPRKIKALRSTYYLEVAKIEKSKGRGDGYVYRTSLRWFKDMEYIMKSASDGNKEDTVNDTENDTQWPIEQKPDPNCGMDTNSDGVFDGHANEVCEPILRQEQPTVIYRPSLQQGRKAILQRITRARNRAARRKITNEAVQEALNYSTETSGSSITSGQEDECEIMGKHIAIQLRELPVHDRLRANFEIQKILMDYRLRNIGTVIIQSTPIISSNQEHSSILKRKLQK